MIKRCVIYCRTSGDDTERDSMSAQERVCQQYAQSKGYETLAVLKEDVKGVSGASFNAPELNKALRMAQQSLFDVLVVRDVSRFARDIEKFILFEPRFKRYGISIEFCWQNFDATPTGQFYKTISAGIAQLEKDMIVQRFQAGKLDKIGNRGSMMVMGVSPLGFDVKFIDGLWTPLVNDNEIAIVRMIFDLYVKKDLSLRGVCKELDKLGTPTFADLRPNAVSKKKLGFGGWQPASVRGILMNELYIGTWKYGKSRKVKEIIFQDNGDVVEKTIRVRNKNPETMLTVKLESTIDRVIFDRAQEKLRANQHSGKNPGYEYLMSKEIRCSCGASVRCQHITRRGANYFYYTCIAKQGDVVGKHCDVRVMAKRVDTAIFDWLYNLLSNKGELTKRVSNYQAELQNQLNPLRENLDIIEEELTGAKGEYNKFVKLWLNADEFEQGLLMEQRKALKQKIEVLQRQYDMISAKVTDLTDSLDALLEWIRVTGEFGEQLRGLFYYEGHHDDIEKWEQEEEQARGKSKDDYTFPERLALIKRFKVKAELHGKTHVKVSCDLGQELLPLLFNAKSAIVQKGKFCLVFSDYLTLPLRTPAVSELVN